MSDHAVRFPNESDEYRQARDQLLAAEIALRTQIAEVAELRRRLPAGGAVGTDYEFREQSEAGGARAVRLSELFASGKDSLLVYSYMFSPEMESPCPACTSIVDGFNGCAEHVLDRTNLVVVGKSPLERLRSIADARGWDRIRLLSSHGSTYNRDYRAESEAGRQLPVLNVFQRDGDGIRHFYATELLYTEVDGHPRHVDLVWPIWNLFDLTPEGRGVDWHPRLKYQAS
jgi:predicted dithiol-disulfide oxidoreductase (DUF899 family)